MRSVPNSNFRFIWNANALYQYGSPDVLNPPWLAYPGDAWVDVIAIDLYDEDYTTYASPRWQSSLSTAQVEAVWASPAVQVRQRHLRALRILAVCHTAQQAVGGQRVGVEAGHRRGWWG